MMKPSRARLRGLTLNTWPGTTAACSLFLSSRRLMTHRDRAEFDRNRTIDKRDFAAIEFLLRKGRRQLDVYSSPDTRDVNSARG